MPDPTTAVNEVRLVPTEVEGERVWYAECDCGWDTTPVPLERARHLGNQHIIRRACGRAAWDLDEEDGGG